MRLNISHSWDYGRGETLFGKKHDTERVEEVKLIPLLREKRVTGEWENSVCVDNERKDPPSHLL